MLLPQARLRLGDIARGQSLDLRDVVGAQITPSASWPVGARQESSAFVAVFGGTPSPYTNNYIRPKPPTSKKVKPGVAHCVDRNVFGRRIVRNLAMEFARTARLG
jgi:hypothetical protein